MVKIKPEAWHEVTLTSRGCLEASMTQDLISSNVISKQQGHGYGLAMSKS